VLQAPALLCGQPADGRDPAVIEDDRFRLSHRCSAPQAGALPEKLPASGECAWCRRGGNGYSCRIWRRGFP